MITAERQIYLLAAVISIVGLGWASEIRAAEEIGQPLKEQRTGPEQRAELPASKNSKASENSNAAVSQLKSTIVPGVRRVFPKRAHTSRLFENSNTQKR